MRCEDGRIAAIGPRWSPEPGDETIDAAGAPLVAPLVNGHTHAAMTLFRGSGGDLPLMPWLQERIWPVEAKLDDEDVYWGARLACAEMTRTGTTRFWDMYWQPEATARAVADAGLRATIGAPLFDRDGDAAADARDGAAQPRARSAGSGRRSRPPSPRTRSTRSARSRCAGSPSSAPSASVPIQIHLAETERGGRGVRRRPRPAPRRLPRPAGDAERAHRARPRRLARPRRSWS